MHKNFASINIVPTFVLQLLKQDEFTTYIRLLLLLLLPHLMSGASRYVVDKA